MTIIWLIFVNAEDESSALAWLAVVDKKNAKREIKKRK
jgi:hypothetical protein